MKNGGPTIVPTQYATKMRVLTILFFGKPSNVRADKTQRQRDIGSEYCTQAKPDQLPSPVPVIKLPDQNHADHRGRSVEDHHDDSAGAQQRCKTRGEKKKCQLSGTKGHLHEQRFQIQTPNPEIMMEAKLVISPLQKLTHRVYKARNQVRRSLIAITA